MRDRVTAIIAIVLLAALAGATYWFSQAGRYAKLAAPVSKEGPDFVVNGVTLTQFDAQGRATNRLFAETMTHYAIDDRAELHRPRFVSLRPDQPQLEARARRALVEGGGERVLLTGDVVITRAPGPDGEPPMRLATEKLMETRVRPDWLLHLALLLEEEELIEVRLRPHETDVPGRHHPAVEGGLAVEAAVRALVILALDPGP